MTNIPANNRWDHQNKWVYVGDVNLEHGGFFWKHERPNDDYVEIVEIIPDSDMGGADNVFHVYVGSLYLDVSLDEMKAAFKCVGDATQQDFPELVYALKAYMGFDVSEMHSIRIGKIDPITNDATVPEIDIWQIRGNTKLKNYVKNNFLY